MTTKTKMKITKEVPVRGQVSLRPVYVPVGLHSKLKAKTAANGEAMKSVIVGLIEDYLKQ